MKILFVGVLNSRASMDWHRCDALRRLGHEVAELDQSPLTGPGHVRRFLRYIDGHPFKAESVARLNAQLLTAVLTERPRIVWIEKGLTVKAETLLRIKTENPDLGFVSYQDDNPFGERRYERPFWSNFVDCIPNYDLHFVKRLTDVAEFKSRGARRVEIFMNGFSESFFGDVPATQPTGHRYPISFLGTRIDDRGALITKLMLRYRLDIHVYGQRWNRCLGYYVCRGRFHGAFAAERYAEIVRASKINLGFVSFSNRDEYTGRSLDIPAAGGFLLTWRTPVHQALYREGVEAEFFSDVSELVKKCRYYLKHEDERQSIAAAGFARSRRDDYSLTQSMRKAIRLTQDIT